VPQPLTKLSKRLGSIVRLLLQMSSFPPLERLRYVFVIVSPRRSIRETNLLVSSVQNKKAEKKDDDSDGESKPTKGKKKLVDMSEKELKKVVEERDNKENKDVKALGQDPWHLKSSDVEDDWTEMKAPPLAMFS
jgi:hypothetical protein